MKTRIIIYDDNKYLGESLTLIINEEPDMAVVAFYSDPSPVLHQIEEFKPDIILMDIDMPKMNGVEAVKLIRTKYGELPIIMLTIFEDNSNIFKAICAGASGYILKGNVVEELIPAIRNVLTGGAPLTASIAKKVLQMFPIANRNVPAYNLTEQEVSVLNLLVKGYSYKMIASELNVVLDTVRYHIKNIYSKLQVHSATEAVSLALKNNITN